MYSSLVMLYVASVLDGKRSIEDVPKALQALVQEVLDEAVKKEDGEQ